MCACARPVLERLAVDRLEYVELQDCNPVRVCSFVRLISCAKRFV